MIFVFFCGMLGVEDKAMKYAIDHDLHIHSELSWCSGDPEQNTSNILEYAKRENLRQICLTDHLWDKAAGEPNDWYGHQDVEHLQKALPLPEAEGVQFLFGCETELNKDNVLGLAPENFDKFDFIIIPTTHMHFHGFTIDEKYFSLEGRREKWIERFEAVTHMDLPWGKVGIGHMTCPLMGRDYPEMHLEILDGIPDATYRELFRHAAKVGAGIELNFPVISYSEEQLSRALRPYRLAKECGCKFYLGSDAHTPRGLASQRRRAEKYVEVLDLHEEDKFIIS